MNNRRLRELAGLPTIRENYAMTALATHQSAPATVSMGDEFRRIAGLPAVPATSAGAPVVHPAQTHAPEPEANKQVQTAVPAAHVPAPIVDEKDEDPTDNATALPADDVEPEYPEQVTKAASDAEGLTGDELIAVIQKLYDAAVKDGKAATAAEEEKSEGEEE
jgi:hypothetical protein